MSVTQNDLKAAAEEIEAENHSELGFQVLTRVIKNQAASKLIQTLIANEKSKRKDAEDAVVEVMNSLQKFAKRAPDNALILMAHLWSVAADLYLHEIRDSIDLWMYDHMSSVIKQYLSGLVSREVDEDNKKHYKEWLEYGERRGQS